MAGTECGHPAAVEEGLAEPLCPEPLAPAGSPAAASAEEAERGGLLAAAAAAGRARPGLSRRGRVLGVVATLCVACAVALLAGQRARPRDVASADAGEATRLFFFSALASAAKVMLTGAKAAKAVGGGVDDFNGLLHNEDVSAEISKLEKRFKLGYNKTVTLDPSWKKFLRNVTENLSQEELREMLFPRVNRHDGNPCYDDEELHAGLCYKRCDLLTFGTHPFRTSAFSCCSRPPCQWDETEFRVSMCGGFDVSGDMANGICPHTPGACLANEELLTGLCYKRCAILTEGEYMFRTGPATCCKFRSQLACTAGAKGPGGQYAVVSANFTTGGGNCTKEMPCAPHLPIAGLAENKVWQPWDNLTMVEEAEENESDDNLTTTAAEENESEVASRLLEDTTAIDEAEAEVASIGIAPASADDKLAAAIAAEEDAIKVVEEAVEAARDAAAVAEASKALSAAESAESGGGTASEGSAATEVPSVAAAIAKAQAALSAAEPAESGGGTASEGSAATEAPIVVAETQAALSAAEPAEGGGGTASEGSAATEAPIVEVAALKK